MANSIYNKEDICLVSAKTIADLKLRALATEQKRFRLCLHHSNDHKTHEMLIVCHRDTFIPPHRHPKGKSESYHVVEGTMTVYFFSDDGKLLKTVEMEKAGGSKPFLYRLSNNLWHMPRPTSKWLVYHETYSGPFDKDLDVEFPCWAPQEGDRRQVKRFLKEIE